VDNFFHGKESGNRLRRGRLPVLFHVKHVDNSFALIRCFHHCRLRCKSQRWDPQSRICLDTKSLIKSGMTVSADLYSRNAKKRQHITRDNLNNAPSVDLFIDRTADNCK